MRSIILVFTTLIMAVFPLSGQSLKAVANYQQEFRMPSQFGGRELSEEQIQRMSRRMESVEPREYVLTISGQRSAYALDADSGRSGQGRWMAMGGEALVYKDLSVGESLSKVTFRDTLYRVTDTLTDHQWELHDETLEIGPLICYKATTKFRRGGNSMRAGFGEDGRGQEAEVVAWYCPEIASEQGPGKYYGLPGLILKVEEPASVIQCTNIELYPEKFEEIDRPEEGQTITAREYAEKLREFARERQRDRGRRN